MPEDTEVVRYTARMNHLFMQRCGLLKALAPFFFAFAFIFFTQFCAWMSLLGVRRETTFPVQRLLAFIPAMMSLQILTYGLDFDTCPWVGASPDQAYLKMGKVCTVTFSYTFIHAIFYVLCHGWSITDQQVGRDQATNLTMVMGVIYLIYSAYFLSADFQSWTEVVNIFVAAVYLCLGVVNLRNLYSQIRIV